jgi:hypothetical protein
MVMAILKMEKAHSFSATDALSIISARRQDEPPARERWLGTVCEGESAKGRRIADW